MSDDWTYDFDNAYVLDATVNNYDPNPFPSSSPNTNGLNSASGGDNSVLGDIWDFTKSTFTGVVSAASDVYKANALAKLQAAQTANQIATRNAQVPPYTAQQRYTISLAAIGSIVLLGTAFVLIQRRR